MEEKIIKELSPVEIDTIILKEEKSIEQLITEMNEVSSEPTVKSVDEKKSDLKEFDQMILSKLDSSRHISVSELNSFLLSELRYLKTGGDLKYINHYNEKAKQFIQKLEKENKLEYVTKSFIDDINKIVDTSNKIKQKEIQKLNSTLK